MTDAKKDPDVPAILGGAAMFPNGPPSWPLPDDEVVAMLEQMAGDGSWGRYFGPHGGRLVERLQDMHGCEHVLLCSSGRAAVELALRGLLIGPEHKVALAAYDFSANFGCVQQVGATPVLIDTRGEDAQLDVAQVEQALSPSTCAVIASHLHGGIVDMPCLRALADERDIGLIEDAAQASGATVYGRPAGMWGDVGVLSFGGTKLLTAGRGGALLTNRNDVAQRIRRYLRGDNHAYPLSEMQAAVLLPQLDRLPERHRQRAEAVAAIRAALDDADGLRLFARPAGDSSPAFYKAGMFYDAAVFDGLAREQFVAAMQAEGLALDTGFEALHTTHSQRRFRAAGELSHATTAGATIVGLHHPVLLDHHADWNRLRTAVERIRRHAAQIKRVAGQTR